MRTPIMSCCRLMAVALFLFCSMPLFAQRQDILLNDNWKFRFSHQVQKGSEIRVDLPHTWNTQDALSGKIDYKRGIGNYEKKLFIRPEWQGKRLFLRFEGANSIADVFINRRHIGEHRGGYGAFVFEITGRKGLMVGDVWSYSLLMMPCISCRVRFPVMAMMVNSFFS